MNGYYDRVETQLRTLTERGAHRRSRVRVTPMVAVAASLILVVAVAAAFVGLRGRSHAPRSSAASTCASADWHMVAQTAVRLDEATVAGISISSIKACHLRLTLGFGLLNRSAALGDSAPVTINASVVPGAPIEQRWAWRNSCGSTGPFWFRMTAGPRSVRVPAQPPPCVDPHGSTGFVRFELRSPKALSARAIGPVRLRTSFAHALAGLGNLLGVFGRRSAGPGCGVKHAERLLDGITAFFGHGRFVGYEYRGRFLTTTAGLRVGDTIARARRLYGPAFKTSAAQGGSWSAHGLIGYLSAPNGGRIVSIDAGNVGCPALTP